MILTEFLVVVHLSSSPILHKNCLQKLGDHRKNAIAEKQAKSTAFMVAWSECILIIEFMEQQQKPSGNLDTEIQNTVENDSNSDKLLKSMRNCKVVLNRIECDCSAAVTKIDELSECDSSKKKKKHKLKSLPKCSIVLERIDPANLIKYAQKSADKTQQEKTALKRNIPMTRNQAKQQLQNECKKQ